MTDALPGTTGLPDVVEVTGRSSGPTVAILGGVHGDELEGVLAARRVARLLDPAGLAGVVRIAAPAHPAAWQAVTRSSPLDGQNLARVFPGADDGTPTERVAAFLTSRLIAGADLLIDLHSAGEGFDMPFLWQHPVLAPGRSLSAAAAHGVPSIYVEGHGGGQVRRRDLDCYVDGVLRVLHHLGMTAAAPAASASVVVRGDGDTDGGIVAAAGGYLVTAVEVGEQVAAGDPLGEIVDGYGTPLATVSSPHDGVVMLLRRRARVAPGDTVAIVAEVVR